MTDFDVAIVGSGFGGSILSMIARRLGLRVVLLERGRHPRFAIGESASPLAGILIEQLADRYDLPRLRPLSAFGTWRRSYPDVACGLKRGFTYFKHEDGQRYRTRPDRSNQLLVAASPNDELSDTHWLRADVDQFLVREAVALGVDYVDQVALDTIEWRAGGRPRLRGVRAGQSVRFDARVVLDASGPRGFLSRALSIADRGFDGYPGTQALYSHFTNVSRCEHITDFDADWGSAPYPADDAALHHVFDGGWMWVLRFGNGVTSAGIAVTEALAAELRLADGEPAWRRFLARYPSIAAQFADATAIRELTWMPRMAYRAAEAAGPGWAMLPSAAGFVDPLFSTGIPLTLLGIERLTALLADNLRSPSPDCQLPTTGYARATLADVDHTAAFVGGCYAAFPRFEAFASYSMFYFAAASYAEMARRINGARRPERFLCADRFGEDTLRLSPSLSADSVAETAYGAAVASAIEPLNIAGLCDAGKRNWYAVDLEDTVRGATKLGVNPAAVNEMLVRSGAWVA
jgi:tetracycline 7-halogenase / FADH2 O2-dependent halogenase